MLTLNHHMIPLMMYFAHIKSSYDSIMMFCAHIKSSYDSNDDVLSIHGIRVMIPLTISVHTLHHTYDLL